MPRRRPSTAISTTTACHGWYNLFGFNGKPGNYVPKGVVDNTTGALGPIGAPRNNCPLPASLVYDPMTQPDRHPLRRRRTSSRRLGHHRRRRTGSTRA